MTCIQFQCLVQTMRCFYIINNSKDAFWQYLLKTLTAAHQSAANDSFKEMQLMDSPDWKVFSEQIATIYCQLLIMNVVSLYKLELLKGLRQGCSG